MHQIPSVWKELKITLANHHYRSWSSLTPKGSKWQDEQQTPAPPGPEPGSHSEGFCFQGMPQWPFHERWEKTDRKERSGMGSSSFMFRHAEEMVGISLLPFSGNTPQPWRWHLLIYASYPSPCRRLFLFSVVLHTKKQNNAGYWLLKTTDLKTSTSNKTRYRSKQT